MLNNKTLFLTTTLGGEGGCYTAKDIWYNDITINFDGNDFMSSSFKDVDQKLIFGFVKFVISLCIQVEEMNNGNIVQ